MKLIAKEKVSIQIEQRIAGQINQIGPARLPRWRISQTGIGHRVADVEQLAGDRTFLYRYFADLEVRHRSQSHRHGLRRNVVAFALEFFDMLAAVDVDQDVKVATDAIGQRELRGVRV